MEGYTNCSLAHPKPLSGLADSHTVESQGLQNIPLTGWQNF